MRRRAPFRSQVTKRVHLRAQRFRRVRSLVARSRSVIAKTVRSGPRLIGWISEARAEKNRFSSEVAANFADPVARQGGAAAVTRQAWQVDELKQK
jgi:hypothetical protein